MTNMQCSCVPLLHIKRYRYLCSATAVFPDQEIKVVLVSYHGRDNLFLESCLLLASEGLVLFLFVPLYGGSHQKITLLKRYGRGQGTIDIMLASV